MKPIKLRKKHWARTRPTKEGIAFLTLTLFVGIAALNTGNNLLYLVFGMMLSSVAASGIISMANLSWLEVKTFTGDEIFAVSPTPLRVSVKNSKRFIPSYSLTIEIEERKAFIAYTPPKGIRNVSLTHYFKKRGWNSFPQVTLSTRFPFGFFKKWIKIELGDNEILVYPRLEKNFENRHMLDGTTGQIESESSKTGDELKSLRTYRQGDNPKHIHWKSTARAGKLILKELYDDQSKSVVIEFNPAKNRYGLESEITRAASAFLELLDEDYEVEFIVPDRKFRHLQSRRSARPVLAYLALFDL